MTFLARRQRFLNNCFTVTTIFIVNRRFVCHHLISSIAVRIKLMLLCPYRKGASRVQYFQVRLRLCHSTFLWRLSCETSPQVHSILPWESNFVTFKPRVMMDEICKVRIVQDIEITSIVQLHSLDSTSKPCVLTQKLNSKDLALAVDGDQNTAKERWRGQMPHSRITVASSGTSSSCFISNGCSFKTWEAVNNGSSFILSLDQALLHQSCRYFMLSDSGVVLN